MSKLIPKKTINLFTFLRIVSNKKLHQTLQMTNDIIYNWSITLYTGLSWVISIVLIKSFIGHYTLFLFVGTQSDLNLRLMRG